MTRYFFLVVVMSTRMKPAPLHAALDLFQLREVQLVAETSCCFQVAPTALTVSSPYFLRASFETSSLTTMQSIICRFLRRRMISSIFSFALGRDTEVESRKPTSPKVRIFDFALPHVRPVFGDEVLELALELGDPVLVGLALLLCGLLGP